MPTQIPFEIIYSSIFHECRNVKGNQCIINLEKIRSDVVYTSAHLSATWVFLFPSPQTLIICLSLPNCVMGINLLLSLLHIIRPTDDAANRFCKPYHYIKSRHHTPSAILNYDNPFGEQLGSTY